MPQEPQDHMLSVGHADEPVFVRHLATNLASDASGSTAVLFVHPGGQDSALWTDPLPESESSWFSVFADAGIDCWALDIRGYGQSSWGSDGPPDDAHQSSRADQAVFDVDAVADHILTTTPADAVHVVGWGWGALVAALFAGETDLPVASLVMLAPRLAEPNDNPAAIDEWILRRNSDPIPSGAELDLADVASGQAVFAPDEIHCPTLLVRAIDDVGSTESDVALLYLLLATEERRLWELPGDHFFVTAAGADQTATNIADWLLSLSDVSDS